MRIWKIAAVTALALSSFAADNVAPTKSELEEMYNKAFRAFDANNFPEALRELDAIDARQPDLAASQNLRGVILMRQGNYDKAQTSLLEAARIDPKFWNARFNLAEIPFLKKDWTEARNRFQQLLSSGGSDLASEASQLVNYKILLTYLLEGKENMVDSILAKLELSSDTPAVDYVKAAVALQHKNQKEAKDWVGVAEKDFSPQLNKLFAESLYEVGWLEKPTGAARPSLPLMTAAERAEKTKAMSRSKFEQAQQALRQRDFVAARKLIDEADQAEPNQAATLNLRGEILMEQKEFEEAEAAFKKAAKLDPKFREAQYNLAQIPFKKKDYAKARERFEALYKQTPGGDKNQAAELIKFKIYMTLLLEGKESRAQAMMEQFQFTGDTPALYYAQAAWEFKHNNAEKAADWTASAKKIYSPALNSIFTDAFYDVGWMQTPEIAAPPAPAPAFDSASAITSQAEGSPAVEPSPIPDSVFAANKRAETSKSGESLASLGPVANPPIAGTKATSQGAAAEQPSVSKSNASAAASSSGQPHQGSAAAVSGSSSGVESAAATAAPAETPIASPGPQAQNDQSAASQTNPSGAAAVATTPATTLGPAKISQPSFVGIASRRTWLVGGLLLAGIFLLAGGVVSQRRRYTFSMPSYSPNGSLIGSRTSKPSKPSIAPSEKGIALGNGFLGGPRQVSLQLTASNALLQRTALRLAQSRGAFDGLADLRGIVSQGPVYQNAEADRQARPVAKPVLGPPGGSVVARTPGISSPSIPQAPKPNQIPAVVEGAVAPVVEPVGEPQFEAIDQRQPIAQMPGPAEKSSEIPAIVEEAVTPVIEPVGEPQFEAIDQGQPVAQMPGPAEKSSEIPAVVEEAVTPVIEPVGEPQFEAIDQDQSIPHQMPVSAMEPSAAAAVAVVPFYSPNASSNEPVSSRTTTPLIMPEQPEQLEPTEVAAAADAPRPAPAAHTPVQLTFSFEIVSVQLTPTFKVRTLQVRPASKLVTMRLASSQRPQPQIQPQVAFEIAKIQPADSGLGTVRLIKSPRQRQQSVQQPVAIASPSFEFTALQPVSSSDDAAVVQLAPSEQGQAHVQVTADFQMAKVEFSSSFEITGVVLNSTSRQVSVQLAGADPSAIEETRLFDIAHARLTGSGDSEILELDAVSTTPQQS
jgi:tetratricopeptide (TPR) repeat protein